MITLIFLMSLFTYNEQGYPELIVEQGVDINQSLELFKSINRSEYRHIDSVTFTNKTNDKYRAYIYYWYIGHKYKHSRIIIYNNPDFFNSKCGLYHELGHSYWLWYNFHFDEQSANEYMLKKDERCLI